MIIQLFQRHLKIAKSIVLWSLVNKYFCCSQWISCKNHFVTFKWKPFCFLLCFRFYFHVWKNTSIFSLKFLCCELNASYRKRLATNPTHWFNVGSMPSPSLILQPWVTGAAWIWEDTCRSRRQQWPCQVERQLYQQHQCRSSGGTGTFGGAHAPPISCLCLQQKVRGSHRWLQQT